MGYYFCSHKGIRRSYTLSLGKGKKKRLPGKAIIPGGKGVKLRRLQLAFFRRKNKFTGDLRY